MSDRSEDTWGELNEATNTPAPNASGSGLGTSSVMASRVPNASEDFPDVPTEIGSIPPELLAKRLEGGASSTQPAPAAQDEDETQVFGPGMGVWPPPEQTVTHPPPPPKRTSKTDVTMQFNDPALMRKLRDMGKETDSIAAMKVRPAKVEPSPAPTEPPQASPLALIQEPPWYTRLFQWLFRVFKRHR